MSEVKSGHIGGPALTVRGIMDMSARNVRLTSVRKLALPIHIDMLQSSRAHMGIQVTL